VLGVHCTLCYDDAMCPAVLDAIFCDDVVGGCGYFWLGFCFIVVVLACCISTVISCVCCGELGLVLFVCFLHVNFKLRVCLFGCWV